MLTFLVPSVQKVQCQIPISCTTSIVCRMWLFYRLWRETQKQTPWERPSRQCFLHPGKERLAYLGSSVVASNHHGRFLDHFQMSECVFMTFQAFAALSFVWTSEQSRAWNTYNNSDFPMVARCCYQYESCDICWPGNALIPTVGVAISRSPKLKISLTFLTQVWPVTIFNCSQCL